MFRDRIVCSTTILINGRLLSPTMPCIAQFAWVGDGTVQCVHLEPATSLQTLSANGNSVRREAQDNKHTCWHRGGGLARTGPTHFLRCLQQAHQAYGTASAVKAGWCR